MSDNLTVFGKDYTGVTGIKAKGTGNGTLTYIRPSGTKSINANGTGIDVASYANVDVNVPTSSKFVITLTLNENGEWEPDKTFTQVKAAYEAGDMIVLSAPDVEGVDNFARMYHYDEDVAYEQPETFNVEIFWFDQGMVVTPEGSDGWEYDYYKLTSEDGWELDGRQPLDYKKTIVEKTLTANGVYNPTSDFSNFAHGYSPVTVNVPKTTLQPLTVTPSAAQQVFNGSVQMGENELTNAALFKNTFNRGYVNNFKLVVGTDYWLKLVRYSSDSGWSDSQIVETYDPVLWTATETDSFPFTATYGFGWVRVNYQNASNTSSSYRYMLYIYPVSSSMAYSPVTVNPIPSQYVVPTGTKSITENGTGIDVASYASVNVAVPSPTPILQSKTNISPTTSSQTITADSGYDGLSSVQINAMPSGTAGTPTATKGTVSNHSVSVTPSVTNTTGYITGGTLTGSAVTVSASELVSGTLSITQNGTHDVTNYANTNVNVSPNLQSKTATPTESQQTITADGGYDGLGTVTVDAINSTYVGSGISTGTIVILSSEGTHNNNYYNLNFTQLDGDPFYSANGQVQAYVPRASMGSATTAQVLAGATFTSSAGIAIEGTIETKNSNDLTVSSATITVPTGYYAEQASKTIASGTEGTPTATKDTVSNHSVSITPSVTNGAGYIEGSTKTGTAVSVSASELVSGTYTVSASGTHDVTNYASASVAAGGATASASKGTVSNHSITVTPSVTRTAGYIAAGSANGTAVTVSASELVSGSETKTTNGTYDVTNLASLVVSVPIVTYHTSSSAPTNSQGSNGDLWLVTS